MTDTLISLISILFGIIGANSTEYIFKKYSFGITGNTIASVFGIVFLIKSVEHYFKKGNSNPIMYLNI